MEAKKVNDFLDIPKMRVINQYMHGSNKILITFNVTTGYTVTVKLTFTGTVTMDWKDGSAPENLTSGTAKTHVYSVAGDYISEVTGNISSITKIECPTTRIKAITGLNLCTQINMLTLTSNLLTSINFTGCKFGGTAAEINLSGNTSLTSITNPSETYTVKNYYANSTGISTFNIAGILVTDYLYFSSNTGMTSVSLETQTMKRLYINSVSLPSIDLTNITITELLNATFSSSLLTANLGSNRLLNFSFQSSGIDTLNVSGCNFAQNNCSLNFKSCAQSAAQVNKILYDCAALVSGEPGGGSYTGRAIDAGGTNADPDNSSGGYDGLAAKASLEAKGFTVNIT